LQESANYLALVNIFPEVAVKLSSLISYSWCITGFSFLHCFVGLHSRASRLSWLAARSHVRLLEHNHIIDNYLPIYIWQQEFIIILLGRGEQMAFHMH